MLNKNKILFLILILVFFSNLMDCNKVKFISDSHNTDIAEQDTGQITVLWLQRKSYVRDDRLLQAQQNTV